MLIYYNLRESNMELSNKALIKHRCLINGDWVDAGNSVVGVNTHLSNTLKPKSFQ